MCKTKVDGCLGFYNFLGYIRGVLLSPKKIVGRTEIEEELMVECGSCCLGLVGYEKNRKLTRSTVDLHSTKFSIRKVVWWVVALQLRMTTE